MVHYPRNGDDIDRGLVGHWKLDDLKRVPTDGIVAHYKMNDDAADRVVIDSKGGNNGVSANNTDTMSAVGKINESLEFNGVDDSITLSNMQDFPENFTICMWIYDDQNIGGDEFGNFMNGGAYGAAENYGIQFGKPGASDSTDVRFNFRNTR